jgi:hypothetical protein
MAFEVPPLYIHPVAMLEAIHGPLVLLAFSKGNWQ